MTKYCKSLVYTAVIALTFSPSAIAQDRLDPSDPNDAILLNQKFTCSLTQGEMTIGYFKGSMYSRRAGEKDRELFKLMGVNVRQCKNYKDKERGHGFKSVSREVMLYLDPETNEVLKTWTNPWTDESVEVVHVANDPVSMRAPRYAFDENGKASTFKATVKNGRVMTHFTVPLFYKNPLGGEYQDYIGGTYHAMEMFNDYAHEVDVFDPDVKKLDRMTFTWTRVSDWLPWMKMGDRGGVVYTATIGARLKSLDDIPEPLKSELNANYKKYLKPPPLNDKRPNRTSWMAVKEMVDADQKGARK